MNANELTKTPRTLVWVTPGTRLEDAMAKMSEHRIHHLPVVENDRVVGMLVERDVLAAFITARSAGGRSSLVYTRGTAEQTPNRIVDSSEAVAFVDDEDVPGDTLVVDRYMQRSVPTIDEATDLREALTRMLESHVSALVVLKEGKLAGLVTESDLLRLLRSLLEKESHEGAAEVVQRGEALLANPLLQSVVKLLGDIGI